MTPLVKRLPRELRNNLGKYLGIFLLMLLTVALTSGFLVAAGSITVICNDIRDTYTLEDGRVTTTFEATDAQLEAAAEAAEDWGGVTFYKNWSIDAIIEGGDNGQSGETTLRTYEHRTQVDIAAYAEGSEPQAANEVAIDRVFAQNNKLTVGSEVTLNGQAFTVVGILTLPDSQALFSSNSDFTISAINFGVAEVSEAGFDALEAAEAQVAYTYSYVFTDRDLSVAERIDAETEMVSALGNEGARVSDLIDADSNQGIVYAADDAEGDSSMWLMLLYIIIVIMGFVFIVLTSATIEEESAIIGTLLASGYRRRELVGHYMALPTLVGLVAAFAGTALGVTVCTDPMKNLYYGSYSLPPFYVTWDWNVFIQTAVVPFVVLVAVTFVGLVRKIGHTPLEFLRHETSKGGVKRGVKLPERLSFTARFRLRIFLRNLGNFATLFVGLCFASTLLLFGLAVLPTMQHYASNLHNTMVAEHQYTLKAPLELEGTASEREAWAAVETLQGVESSKLTEIEDAADELQGKADALESAGTTLQSAATELESAAAALTETPTEEAAAAVESAQAAAEEAQTAFETAQSAATDAQDALYEKLDALAGELGVTRDELTDMVEAVEDIDLDDENIHPVNTTDNGAEAIAQAEKYAVYQLEYDRGGSAGTESITVYGVQEGSSYWNDLNVGDGRVVLGGGLVDKFGFAAGDELSLYDKYEDTTYTLAFADAGDVWGTKSDMNIYLELSDFNELFGNDGDYFCAYASNEALQLDARYVASELTPADMDAIGNEFVNLMSSMIGMLVGLSVAIFLIFMYLLTKSIIDRSARSISYMKVFGYRNGEVSKLYVRSITWCVVISMVVCQPLIIWTLGMVFRAMLLQYNGNIEIFVPDTAIIETIAIGIATYAVVAMLHLRSVRKVPLELALKTQE